ncbi:MAG: TRAP transporter large permease subunit, partial [Alphaproteobacteria bacterium]|nr:TRAP transporter large permease subunit [Alphaproteobacteria bacterium]
MSERELIGIGGLAALFILISLRIPVALAMVMVGIGGNFVLGEALPYLRFGPYLNQFKTLFWSTVANYELSVVPLFILMGFLATQSGVSRDLFHGLNALVGRIRGGVAIASIGACAGFGAVCGSSLATASTMGQVALPELRRLNYSPRLATGTLAAGGTLGILIPPSVILVIYAILVETSIIDMFRAAIIPGLIAVALFVAVISVIVRLYPEAAPRAAVIAPDVRRRRIRRLIPVAVIFGAIILGLGLGIFTPTPAAGMGVFAMLVYGFFFKGSDGQGLNWPRLRAALLSSAVASGMIYFILFGAEVFKGFITRSGLPATLADWAAISGFDPWIVLVLMLVLLIVLGCFMESLSMILVAVPFFWPVLIEINGGDFATAA